MSCRVQVPAKVQLPPNITTASSEHKDIFKISEGRGLKRKPEYILTGGKGYTWRND
jgi:hypothetical protein